MWTIFFSRFVHLLHSELIRACVSAVEPVQREREKKSSVYWCVEAKEAAIVICTIKLNMKYVTHSWLFHHIVLLLILVHSSSLCIQFDPIQYFICVVEIRIERDEIKKTKWMRVASLCEISWLYGGFFRVFNLFSSVLLRCRRAEGCVCMCLRRTWKSPADFSNRNRRKKHTHTKHKYKNSLMKT